MQEEISFGVWLRKQRRALDLSRQAFANQVGCAPITLRRIESGTLKPSKELAHVFLEKLGIPESERSEWVSYARGVSGFPSPSLPLSNKRKSNLPAPLTTFIGRDKEQAQVIGLLTKHRLATLTGPGGVGKTRLSTKVGERVLSDYEEGVWLVELAPILDALLVPRTTALAVGLRDEAQRPIVDMLSDYLREKKILLILDNCEHLLDACAQFADTLLRRCPNLKILATSREALGILGEAVYPVPSLELPDHQQLVERFRDYESVRLFEERAQLARMDFSLTLENVSSVARICSQLDGIPLAIELAAAQVGLFSAEQIAVRLQESFRLLTTGNRAALPRHQTLQAAIDWSYHLLTPAEKTLFRRLSVFVGGWTLEAAESICSDTNIQSGAILGLLTQLINKSLVTMDEMEGRTRYFMLETLRQYSKEKLVASVESDILSDRHLNYFLDLAETAEPHLIRTEQIEWLPLLDADYQNLRLALERALNKPSAEHSLNLCRALWWYWVIRSYGLEGRGWVERALAKPPQAESMKEKAARARALYVCASLDWILADIENVLPSAQASLALALEVSNQRDIAIARLYMGDALHASGADNDRALPLLEQSLKDFQMLNEPFWEALCYETFGLLLAQAAKLKYQNFFSRWLELVRMTGERFITAGVLLTYADWLFRIGREKEAREYAQEAEHLSQQIGLGNNNESSDLIAEIAWANGDIEKARSLFIKLYENSSLIGNKVMALHYKAKLGSLHMEEGGLEQARIDFERSLAIALEMGMKPYIANRLIDLSKVFYLQGNVEAFKQHVREAFALRKNFIEVQKTDILLGIIHSVYLHKTEISARLLGRYSQTLMEHDRSASTVAKRHYHQAEAHVRKTLGNAAFESAFAEGQTMSLDEALDLASKTIEEME